MLRLEAGGELQPRGKGDFVLSEQIAQPQSLLRRREKGCVRAWREIVLGDPVASPNHYDMTIPQPEVVLSIDVIGVGQGVDPARHQPAASVVVGLELQRASVLKPVRPLTDHVAAADVVEGDGARRRLGIARVGFSLEHHGVAGALPVGSEAASRAAPAVVGVRTGQGGRIPARKRHSIDPE